MWRAVLLALALVGAGAAGARYADYAAAPQYGDYDEPRRAVADYHGRSPDAPAALDYKYEDDRRSKTKKPSKKLDETDIWRKPSRKQRGLLQPTDVVNKYSEEDDEASGLVPSPRRAHRARPYEADAEAPLSPPRRAAEYDRDGRPPADDADRNDYLDRGDGPEDKMKEFDDDVSFVTRSVTRRAKRRKPRDRIMKRYDVDFNTDDDILEPNRRMKSDDERAESDQYSAAELERRRRPGAPRARPGAEEHNKLRQRAYDEYNDYYDMKRVHGIKEKLPSLLRRTSVNPSPATSVALEFPANRRLGVAPAPRPRPAASGSGEASDNGESSEVEDKTAASNASKALPAATAPLATSPLATSPSSASLRRKPTTVVAAVSAAATAASASQELSLAEKSRLSILKKAQRKEGSKSESTSKPPVLLQVTHKLPTVVMVEPPASLRPWMRLRELSRDSPERLERVKKLMRHKLVAQAKSIHDLTDNWDEMVCDYIDVALLDSRAAPSRADAALTLLGAFVCFFR